MTSNNGNTYNNERPLSADIDYASDPASGGFFHSDYKKHDDLKQMLDGNKDGLKLEAMKRIIGMVAKGRDASDLFPAVVKNVVSKNLEVKKLVYVYLVRYAEEQQDLALLSIAAFQRALKDPNQLIRASALRVLSSIRVTMIVPIVMLAIRDSASDMSPYVRKTAAHAIPKLFNLDPEQKDDLIQVIEKLLADKTTLVVGSAVMAFEEVCPDRIDLIHKNYRKLCNLLVDVDEWGQVVIMNMLVRYARTQFVNPQSGDFDDNDNNPNKPFYADTDSEEEKKGRKTQEKSKPINVDSDHRLLLRQSKPLLQSRNAAVVMGVAQLYYHLAPRTEVPLVTKALIRLLRSHREVQTVVLNCIASMSTFRNRMFDAYIQSFYVRTSDPTHIKLLKLEILTNLATEVNIGVILREFQTYISSHDKVFVAAAIQAIGRCAANINEVTDTCLNGLVTLLSNRDEAVVAESVVVIKNLLQTRPEEHKEIISKMARLMDHITVAQARSSILWLLGEYSGHVPKIAPDVLRKMAKSFISEEDSVKMQIINLAVKLYLTNPAQTTLLCQYVLNLAKYDQNYDLRDRARFLRNFIFPAEENSRLHKHTKDIFLASKPAPIMSSKFKDREHYQLGSLSHYLNSRANGYHELPSFPEVAPESSVRNVEMSPPAWEETKKSVPKVKTKITQKNKSFYSDSDKDSSPVDESSEEEDSDEDRSTSNGEKISNDDESESSSEDDSSSEEEDDDDEEKSDKKEKKDTSEEETSDETSDGEKNSAPDTDSEEEKNIKVVKKPQPTKATPQAKTNLDLLLDLDEPMSAVTPVLTPSMGGFFTPLTPSNNFPQQSNTLQYVSATFIPYKTSELVNKLRGGGLQIDFRFTRSPHLYSPKMATIEFMFTNHGPDNVADVKFADKALGGGRQLHEFAPIPTLPVGSQHSAVIGIDFNDSTQPVNLNFTTASGRTIQSTLKFAVGEIIRAVFMPEAMFDSERAKLKGMNEHSSSVTLSKELDVKTIKQRIFETVNVGPIPSSDICILKFAGQTLSSQSLVFINAKVTESLIEICVNCEKMVIGSMLLSEVKTTLSIK